jgi:D-alanyl-D-alanine carboxypeptidase
LKTGSIKGVKTIAGYLFPKKSSPVIVALFSENLDPKVNWNEVEDQVIEAVLEN